VDKAKITIGRIQGFDSGYVRITVTDADAGIEFLDLRLTLNNFAEALTGLGNTECEITLRGLENLGKRKERDSIEFPMPDCQYSDKKVVAAAEARKATPEGWIASDYFNSQDSFFRKDGQEYGRTSISRWINKD